MKRFLTFDEADSVLREQSGICRFVGPVVLPKRGRFSDSDLTLYRPVTDMRDLVFDRKTYRSPKEFVFEITGTLLRFVNGTVVEPPLLQTGTALFCRSCDIHAIERLDAIFLRNGTDPDPYYAALRQSLHLILVECSEPFDSCFCVAMGTGHTDTYDLAIRPVAGGLFIDCASPWANTVFGSAGVEHDWTLQYPGRNGNDVTVPATTAMPPELFTAPMWEEYSRRCIACGRCNTSCPTCSCFSVFDTPVDGAPGPFTERKRIWDGCHLDGFTDMAGGAAVRKEYGARMRFKTFHKIYDYRKRFGRNMCVGCGRCDDVCPEYISFANCISRVAALIDESEVRS